MKKLLCLTLSLLILLTCSGCGVVLDVLNRLDGGEAIANAEAIPRIGFSSGVLFADDSEIILPASDLSDYASEFTAYRSSLHYDTLSSDEQTVYRALEYAMEQGYTNILVDDLLIRDADALDRIVRYLSLDSPLLEQNLRCELGDFTTYYPVDVAGVYEVEATFDGYYLTVKNFDKQWLDGKREAIKTAEEIVASLPDDLDDGARAETLYRYLAENVAYEDDRIADENTVYPYLYDALITGATHCDGFANALSLLYRMAGIDCAEKMYDGDAETQIGHTWNLFCIDGVWYNADASASGLEGRAYDLAARLNFGFGDFLQSYPPEYADLYPDCPDGLYLPVDAHVTDVASADFLREAHAGYALHDYDWTLIVADSFDEETLGEQAQAFANYYGCGFNWTYRPTVDERTAILLYDDDVAG